LFEVTPDPQLGIDRQGRIVVANQAAGQLFSGDVTGLPVADVLDLPSIPGSPSAASVTGRIGAGDQSTARRSDGSAVPVRLWRSPVVASRISEVLTLQDQGPDRAVEAAHRSQRHEIHALRGQVSAVLAAVTDRAVLLVDPQGYLTEVNRAAEKLLGRRAAELVGRPLSLLSHPEDLDAVRTELSLSGEADPLLELARAGLPNRQGWTLIGSEGRSLAVHLSITTMPVADTGAPGFVVVATGRGAGWEPMMVRPRGERLLLDLDDAETRTLRWQVGGSGGSGAGRRR
jgi:PAS domain S-box-containing protein